MSSKRLSGQVVKLTFRRLKDGRVRHYTRIEFDPGTPFKAVSLTGTIEGTAPSVVEGRLLLALLSRYDVPGLPEARWTGVPGAGRERGGTV